MCLEQRKGEFMNKDNCMIQSTRLRPTTIPDLEEAYDKTGLTAVYNRGQSDMYDYLMEKLNLLYIHHMVSDYEKPNLYVLTDFFNEFKEFIREDDGHSLEEELDNIMEYE